MVLPLSPEEFSRAVAETVKSNQLRQGIIKILCYYPQISVEIIPPDEPLSVSIFVLGSGEYYKGKTPWLKPTTAGLSKWRKLNPETVPVAAKAAANY